MTTSINFASLLTFTGAGKAKREKAFSAIAKLAQLETTSRDALIADCKAALGTAPSDPEVAAVRLQVQIGRVAGKITRKHLATPAQVAAYDADPLAFALDLVTKYAAPPKEGAALRQLRAGQIGRRTVAQHQLVRASDEAWSKLAADIGIGGAETRAAKKAKENKRAARTADTKSETKAAEFGKDTGKPDHATLSQAVKPLGADDAVQHVTSQASALLAYANKYASVMPAGMGAAIQAFKAAVNKAANDHALAKAEADAKAAEKAK